ncbi:MAG TPA: response regulator transcription factor [Puia sp.]|jgi:DNA-binding NarL/FixJ family response regulator|nr:response regulator transcription factor [Puia sp.]
MSVRIAIFDDNTHLLDSMRLLLDTEAEFRVVGVFDNVLECVGDVRNCRPDVVLMDIEMPGMTGIDAVRVLKKEMPGLLILMQTVFEDDDRIFDAICNGASGYILKNQVNGQLVSFIKELVAGGSPMSPSVARRILTRVQQNWPGRTVKPVDYGLTVRELEVLNCIVAGLSHKMIGSDLNIGYETVRSHVKKIYEKLQVASLTEAVAKALQERIV